MYYYHVLVCSNLLRSQELLTYTSSTPVKKGQLLWVPLKDQLVMGIAMQPTQKPRFSVKSVAEVVDLPVLPAACLQLFNWLSAYYPAPFGPLGTLFTPPSLPRSIPTNIPFAQPVPPAKVPPLTTEQAAVLHRIAEEPTQRAWLLHGQTGSGKTRLYSELAQQALTSGKSVLVLTPEIGLTTQLAQVIASLTGYPVIIWHSNQTPKQHREFWLQILRATSPYIVVGPRSSLFAPHHNLGLIVIDEAHDAAYKQEQLPYYNALRVAGKLAELHNSLIIHGSSTPLVSEYYLASQKRVPILRMENMAQTAQESSTTVEVVDMTKHELFCRNPAISDLLLDHIQTSLKNKQQVLLFLNRRGTARLALCQNCGWHAACPNCDIALTYHNDTHQLKCHTCGYVQPAVTSCPECKSTDISYRSIGTKMIEQQITQLFPDARTQRFDSDNLKSERLEQQYQAIHAGDIDILIGTQLLIKGLDLPLLGVVGILAADSSLYFPDYNAEEQTFQMLSQAMGRVGRGHTSTSNVVVQTYNPDNKTLLASVKNDWQLFYSQQIAERKQFGFPPFTYLLKISCKRKTSQSAEKVISALADKLATEHPTLTIVGPAARFIEKSQGYFYWQLLIKSPQRSQLLEVVKLLPGGFTYDLDPSSTL